MLKNRSFLKPVQNRLKLDEYHKNGLNFGRKSVLEIESQKKKKSFSNFQKTELIPKKNPFQINIQDNSSTITLQKEKRKKSINEQEKYEINIISRTSESQEKIKTTFNISKRRVTSRMQSENQAPNLEQSSNMLLKNTNSSSKINLKPQSSHFLTPEEKCIETPCEIEECVDKMMIELYEAKYFHKMEGYITIRQNCMMQLIISIIEMLNSISFKKKIKNFIQIESEVKKMRKIIEQKLSQKAGEKLSLKREVFSEFVDSKEYKKEVDKIRYNLFNLKEEQIKLEGDVYSLQMLKRDKGQLEKQIEEMQNLIKDLNHKKDLSETQIQGLRTQWELLAKEYDSKTNDLKTMKENYQKITNFIENQDTWPLIKYVGEQYKKLQDQIIDYAAYLQNDALFSTYNWQPKPYTVVQKYILQDLKNLTDGLLYDNETIEIKVQKMNTFLDEAVGKFKRSNDDLREINNDKTKAIRQFVQLMQKWAQNFDIKRDTLVDLRKQFAFDSERINFILGQVCAGEDLPQAKKEQLLLVMKHWSKVEENYKFGNFFY